MRRRSFAKNEEEIVKLPGSHQRAASCRVAAESSVIPGFVKVIGMEAPPFTYYCMHTLVCVYIYICIDTYTMCMYLHVYYIYLDFVHIYICIEKVAIKFQLLGPYSPLSS